MVRARVALDEFGEQARPVLDELTDGRLLTISEGEVEVAHEALLREWPRLRGWLEEDVQGRHLHHQLRNAAREWDAVGRDPGELYRGARLASTLEWATDHEADLNATERAFLAQSRTASERSQRRLRAVLAAVAALLVVAVIAGVVALDQRGNARDEATAAEAQQLGARALLDPELDRSLLLARQAVRLDDTVRTRGNLLGALLRSPAAIGVIRADRATILSAAANPDGNTLAVGNIAGQVLFFDTRTRRHVATLEPAPNHPGIFALAYSPDGSRLAVAYTSVPGATAEFPRGWRVLVALVDARTRRVVERLEMPRERPIAGMQFSPDGRTVGVTLYGGPVGTMMRFDVRTGRRSGAPVPFEHPGRLTIDPFQLWPRSPVMFTTDGRQLVVGGEDGVTVRDAATLSVLKRFPEASKASIRTVPTAYALSGDDRTVAIGGEDGSLRLLDLTTGKLQTASGRHRAAVNEARFTPDRRTLVTTSEDGDVILWDVRQAAAAETLSGHARSAFSPQIARQRQDALHRQPRRHRADLGSRRPPPPRAALPSGAGHRRVPPLRPELRRAPARARAGRRRDQPRGHANADTAEGISGRERQRGRRSQRCGGHRLRARQPSARRWRHIRLARASRRRSRAGGQAAARPPGAVPHPRHRDGQPHLDSGHERRRQPARHREQGRHDPVLVAARRTRTRAPRCGSRTGPPTRNSARTAAG